MGAAISIIQSAKTCITMSDLRQYSHRLTFLPENIWTARGNEDVSYPAGGNDICFGIEDNSFWYRHRNRCIAELMNSYPPGGCLFDIGGGNGTVAARLQQSGLDVIVVEPGKQGALNARDRGVGGVVWASLEEAGFLTDALPSVGLFDVLEHVENEQKLLCEVRRILKPGGRLYVTVPAYNWLWSPNDVHLGHFRRYSRQRLAKALHQAGMRVEYSTYLFMALPIPILITRTIPGRLGFRKSITALTKRREHLVDQPGWSRIITFVLNREIQRLRQNKVIPIGASCLAVAVKPGPTA